MRYFRRIGYMLMEFAFALTGQPLGTVAVWARQIHFLDTSSRKMVRGDDSFLHTLGFHMSNELMVEFPFEQPSGSIKVSESTATGVVSAVFPPGHWKWSRESKSFTDHLLAAARRIDRKPPSVSAL